MPVIQRWDSAFDVSQVRAAAAVCEHMCDTTSSVWSCQRRWCCTKMESLTSEVKRWEGVDKDVRDSWPCISGEGNGIPLQYSCLENPMDGGAWKAAVHGVAEGRTWLSDFTFTFHFHAFEKEMATHSSVLAWRIPWTGEPGGLLSTGSHRVGHDWGDLAAAGPGLEY